MSKELEALSKIVNYDINDSGKCVADYCEEECEVVAKALTPPTAEEVSKALSEIEGLAVRYEAKEQAFINECEHTLIVMMDSGLLLRIYDTYPPHLITLIGRFYEGVEQK